MTRRAYTGTGVESWRHDFIVSIAQVKNLWPRVENPIPSLTLRACMGVGIIREVLRFASCEAVLDEGGLAVFTKNTTSCRFFLANAVCWCCASHPAKQSWTRAGSPNTEASIRRLGATRAPSSPTRSPSRRASAACSGSSTGASPPKATRPTVVYLPAFGGVNLIFLISSTIWPSCTVPETAVIARTTLAYLRP